ncbi:hypothetical protein KCU99_g9548, partial [Aureobasidium melanogenum]
MPPFVLEVRDYEAEQEPFELGPLPSDFPLNGDENLEVVHFFTEYNNPLACDDNRGNRRLGSAKLWHRHQPAKRDTISENTFIFRDNNVSRLPFDLVREVYHNGHKVLKICQYPLLAIHSALLETGTCATTLSSISGLRSVLATEVSSRRQ